jgi:hypothetical protein
MKFALLAICAFASGTLAASAVYGQCGGYVFFSPTYIYMYL